MFKFCIILLIFVLTIEIQAQPIIFENDSTLFKELKYNNYEWEVGYAMTCINGRKNNSPKYDKFVCNIGFNVFDKIEVIQNEKYVIHLNDKRIIEKKENFYYQQDSLPVNSYIIYLTNNEIWIINLTLKKSFDLKNKKETNKAQDTTKTTYKIVGYEENFDAVEKILDLHKK